MGDRYVPGPCTELHDPTKPCLMCWAHAGVRAERAAVVAWLRETGRGLIDSAIHMESMNSCALAVTALRAGGIARECAAEAIERGEHVEGK